MKKEIEKAVQELKRGALVAFPTETVYGLGADAASHLSLEKLYSVKGRPRNHPVIVHLGEKSWLTEWAVPNDFSAPLVEAFWPGPLTLILRRRPGVLDLVTGGQDTVAVRMPGHPLALALLREYGKALAAPSANRFGRVSPTSAEHVRREFGSSVMILDGGECQVGLESTILDISGEEPTLLRPGHVTPSQLSSVLNRPIATRRSEVRAPGTLHSHYAPETPAFLVESDELKSLVTRLKMEGKRVALLCKEIHDPSLYWLEAADEPEDYARLLYANLRLLDAAKADQILIEKPTGGEAWAAVHDRLTRATSSATP